MEQESPLDDPSPPLPEVAALYAAYGWNPIELPPKEKYPPPAGLTGADGIDMTLEQIAAAAWAGNIGMRMPADVIGLDVDAYRGGMDSLNELIIRLVKLPPTYIAHSGRNDNSGIRFYRVPQGYEWITSLPGIDIIQRAHRYACVWPSTHPDDRVYSWWDQQAKGPADDIPHVEDLPELPWEWIEELSRAKTTDGTHARAANPQQTEQFLDDHTAAESPTYITSNIAKHFIDEVAAGRSRHDTMQHCLLWSMEWVRAGLADARTTVRVFEDLWTDCMKLDPRRAELRSQRRTTEFQAMLQHAIGKITSQPQAKFDRLHDDTVGPTIGEPTDDYQSQQQQQEDEEPSIFVNWRTFAQRGATARRWLVEGFWPAGRAMSVWGPAKEGKTDLVEWCAVKLALGEDAWSNTAVDPVDVIYLDFEMTEDDLEERLDQFDVDVDRLEHLHYALLPPLHALDTEAGGKEVAALVKQTNAQAVIIDTFTRAIAGDENEADTVRAFYRHTAIRMKQLGIGVIRIDHAGKKLEKGQRGSSAKLDDVDIAWRVTRTKAGLTVNCAKASRLSWVGPTLNIERITDPVTDCVRFTTPIQFGWPNGTAEKAAQLDKANVPLNATRVDAIAALKANNIKPGRFIVLDAALRYRREASKQQKHGGNRGGNRGLFSDEDD